MANFKQSDDLVIGVKIIEVLQLVHLKEHNETSDRRFDWVCVHGFWMNLMINDFQEVIETLDQKVVFVLFAISADSIIELLQSGEVDACVGDWVSAIGFGFLDKPATKLEHIIITFDKLLICEGVDVFGVDTNTLWTYQRLRVFAIDQHFRQMQKNFSIATEFSKFLFGVWILLAVIVEAYFLGAAILNLLE